MLFFESMDNQDDIDFINNKLYSLDVPNEPIKNIMFYFPYFSSSKEMENFLILAKSLNPDFLYHHNVIIYFNDKTFYKYYQLNDDQNGKPYEFKIIDAKESLNPLFNSNYQNVFNI